ncbi:HprK-related kinase B [Thiomicrorhabdus sp. 6S2-11]|uniref:HprK-related kinase B n=1 Tax=Thiomicrorhabdus marina TaxID=2818442 RepID=A0ABS3Q6Q0_9GAMM|nr:HprK-related kinase B [Thiomicrorhabdus marina]MBO1927951.1 HprK-related kinase B [Thiomicrorhabdus marina]
MSNPTALYQQLISHKPQALAQNLWLILPQASYRLFSNSQNLLNELHDYFVGQATWQAPNDNHPLVTEIYLWQSTDAATLIAATPWEDWLREAGKSGRKDAVYDLHFTHGDIRLLHKVKTGMLFVQPSTNNSHDALMAFGPAEQHPNQMINFILTQYLNQHLREDWLLGHAAGLQIKGKGLAIAGLSGGGKSTLMLQLLEDGEHFISNDRLLFDHLTDTGLSMRGIPKQPRINPGTIVHNSRLHPLMNEQQRADFLAMPQEELRALELKYDAPVDKIFWPNCYQGEAKLDYLVILNWQVNSDQTTSIKQTTLEASPELIPALMKSPGPFYCSAEGEFLKNGITPDAETYRQRLGEVPVLELNGKVDFTVAKQLILDTLSPTESFARDSFTNKNG